IKVSPKCYGLRRASRPKAVCARPNHRASEPDHPQSQAQGARPGPRGHEAQTLLHTHGDRLLRLDQTLRQISQHALARRPATRRSQMELFLSDLAVNGKVAASTQNQAFNALLFLYRQI